MFIFGDWTFILLIPALIFSIYSSWKVKSVFEEYSKKETLTGLTGSGLARFLLDRNDLYYIDLEETRSWMGDHYDPAAKVLRLSPDVYRSNSITALGVAAHETGHAIQEKEGYLPFIARTALVPVANIGSSMAFPMFFLGFLFSWPAMLNIGIIFFFGAVIFYVVTLPVEFNASYRALAMLENGGLMTVTEIDGARKVLWAAAMTYLASACMAITELLRMILLKNALDR